MNKPTIQQVRQQVAQGMLDEAKSVAQTASEQIGIPVAQTLPDYNEFNNSDQFKEEVKAQESQRMAELRVIIENEMRNAKVLREQKVREIAQMQAQEMQKDENHEDKKTDFLASLGHAAKRIRGRLGQVGKGKMEKGRGGGG